MEANRMHFDCLANVWCGLKWIYPFQIEFSPAILLAHGREQPHRVETTSIKVKKMSPEMFIQWSAPSLHPRSTSISTQFLCCRLDIGDFGCKTFVVAVVTFSKLVTAHRGRQKIDIAWNSQVCAPIIHFHSSATWPMNAEIMTFFHVRVRLQRAILTFIPPRVTFFFASIFSQKCSCV